MNKCFRSIIAGIIAVAVTCSVSSGALAVDERYTNYPLSKSDSLKGKTVFIDPGHGAGSGGGFAGYIEHPVMLDIAQRLENNLKRQGAEVIMTRYDESNPPLSVRVSMINKYSLRLVRKHKERKLEASEDKKEQDILQSDIDEIRRLEALMQSIIDDPDGLSFYYNDPYDYSYQTVIHPDIEKVFAYCDHPAVYNNVVYISLHSNATPGGSTSANGLEVYISSNANDHMHYYFNNYSETKVNNSYLYASLLLAEVSAATKMKARDTSISDSAFYMTRETNVPGVLIELGYHTNSSDRAKLESSEYRTYMANAMALATIEYFAQTSGLYKPPKEEPKKESDEKKTVLGDVSGDGEVTLLDLLMIQKHLLELDILEGEKLKAADVNRDGTVTLLDLLIVQRYLLGVGALE